MKNLGELQLIVNEALFAPEKPQGNPILGWSNIAMISDLSKLIPTPVPTIDRLVQVWKADWKNFKTDEDSADRISNEIDKSRKAVFNELYKLR